MNAKIVAKKMTKRTAEALDMNDDNGKSDNNKIALWVVLGAVILAHYMKNPFTDVTAGALIGAVAVVRGTSIYTRKKFAGEDA